MGRGNKNTAVAALIKEQILSAASRLFIEKGFSASRIDDISAMSGYSRRTIYAYFESKEDILDHITVKGLSALLGDIRSAAASDRDITGRWLDICGTMLRYKAKYPTSDRAVEASSPDKLTEKELSPARKEILRLGSEINDLLAGFIRDGISSGEVRPGIIPEMSVYVLWAGVSSLADMARTKGGFIARQFGISREDFLEYGFRQLLSSVLVKAV